jgi:hypothetical protein
MTLTSTATKLSYNGDGATDSFAVTFIFWDLDDLRVILRDENVTPATETVLVRGATYNVTGGNGSTGTVTIITPPSSNIPASGEKLIIKSDVPTTQTSSLPLGGALPSTTIEQRLDKNVRLTQQAEEVLSRAPLLEETTSLTNPAFPAPGAGQYIRWNVGGTALETDAGSINNSNFLQSGTGAVTRSVTSKIGQVFDVKDFGATGDGVTDDTAAITLAETAWRAKGSFAALHFPEGTYLSTAGKTITCNVARASIFGAGHNATRLKNISIEVQENDIDVRDLELDGDDTATFGLKMSKTLKDDRRYFKGLNLVINGYTTGVDHKNANGQDLYSNCKITTNVQNVLLDADPENQPDLDPGDIKFMSCILAGATSTTLAGTRIRKGGVDFVNCKFQGNAGGGIEISGISDNFLRAVRLTDCSLEDNGTRTFTISGVTTDAGDAVFTTSTAHGFRDGMHKIDITGTTSYNGTSFIVDSVTSATFKLYTGSGASKTVVSFVADETGTVTVPGWDVLIDVENTGGAVQTSDTREIQFNGGNSNYTKIANGSAIRFIDHHVKYQCTVLSAAIKVDVWGSNMGRYDALPQYIPLDDGAQGVPSNVTHIQSHENAYYEDFNGDKVFSVDHGAGNSKFRFVDDKNIGGIYESELHSTFFGSTRAYTPTVENISLDDDTATSFTPPESRGVILIGTVSGAAVDTGIICYKADATEGVTILVAGANVEVTTGVLTGTTGTDTKLVVSASAGKIYIENRRGSTKSIRFTLFAA